MSVQQRQPDDAAGCTASHQSAPRTAPRSRLFAPAAALHAGRRLQPLPRLPQPLPPPPRSPEPAAGLRPQQPPAGTPSQLAAAPLLPGLQAALQELHRLRSSLHTLSQTAYTPRLQQRTDAPCLPPQTNAQESCLHSQTTAQGLSLHLAPLAQVQLPGWPPAVPELQPLPAPGQPGLPLPAPPGPAAGCFPWRSCACRPGRTAAPARDQQSSQRQRQAGRQ